MAGLEPVVVTYWSYKGAIFNSTDTTDNCTAFALGPADNNCSEAIEMIKASIRKPRQSFGRPPRQIRTDAMHRRAIVPCEIPRPRSAC